MTRHEFLKTLGAMMIGGFSSAYANSTKPNTGKKRIVVIGAGLAGLAAARELQHSDHEVVVIEARERIGGRISTSMKWKDAPLDLGASWIHGVKGNPLTELADEVEADRLITNYDSSITYNSAGNPISKTEEERLDELRSEVYKQLMIAQNQDSDVSVRQAISPLLSQFDDASVEYQFLSFVLSSEFEQEFSGSADNISAHWYDSIKEFEGNDAIFVQGFKVITEFLAHGLTIELGQIVNEIQWNKPQVRVITQRSEFVADHVIVTIPLGVLQEKRVRFYPDLPTKKLEAIDKLGMGLLNKCYLRFEEAFWPEDVDWLEYISPKHGQWTEWVSFQQAAKQPILLGFNSADRAKELESWSDQEIVADAMKTLRNIFGEDIPEPIDYQMTRWGKDPFSLGTYSFNALVSTPNMRSVLAESLENKVFFAGEATERDYFGTAHGAYLSGLRAARETIKA